MKYIKTEIDFKTAILTVDREKKLNALNSDVIVELNEIIDNYIADSSISSIIITGAGNKSFIAGADIAQMLEFSSLEASNYSKNGILLFNKIEKSPKPIIAAINGYALGGGCELALACHIRYSSEESLFGLPEVTLGLIPGFGGTQRLKRIVGPGLANELIFSGKYVDSKEALRIGLVNKMCDDVIEESMKLCNIISKNSPLAISHAIKSMACGEDVSYFDSFDIENNFFSQLFNSYDSKEGMQAFVEKRKPLFKGK